ncbi:Crp/Fnr family transcriptional regulator [Haloflavibacter putidus]|uniref:Crp/Fnr family transcriptional regulator n=1 Tax=Haloflavibacter putidus TaxID=2576776 RepID=A0A507ZRV6_9FLAO|nr:Crp/Fnr family transcriptional regulator [Haloflavibacter putidus]TQD39014.1 Crp/Fnr family transcriptional regulator [Haloflavibacter putidus]
MISATEITKFGAEKLSFQKDEYIFREGEKALYYYQVASGDVKMNNYHEDGKEFIQAIFSAPRSFGEPPLFAEIGYPANAIAVTKAEVYRIPKKEFFKWLLANPSVHLQVSKGLATRLHYKAIMASELSQQNPENRILRILDYLKQQAKYSSNEHTFKVDLTRQQIADLTGLRVETVIRTIKSLAAKDQVKIIERKVYR